MFNVHYYTKKVHQKGGNQFKIIADVWNYNEPNPWGLNMPALQYNVLPHLPKVNKEQARM